MNQQTLPPIDLDKATPLFHQYFELKEKAKVDILLMRVGDFYEAYSEDAILLAEQAEIILTSKEAGKGQRTEMAGVPFHSLDPHLRVLIEKGSRVAIAEQMEEAGLTKGLVKREIVRIVTSGTVVEPAMLDENSNNFLMAVVCSGESYGVAFCDVSTGTFQATELECERLADEILRFRPAEMVVTESARGGEFSVLELCQQFEIPIAKVVPSQNLRQADEQLKRHFALNNFKALDLEALPLARRACASLLEYVEFVQPGAKTLSSPSGYRNHSFMVLDVTTQRNLELTHTLLGGEKKGSLLWSVDETKTPMGARMLRRWITQPLLDVEEIQRRQEAVGQLLADSLGMESLRALLSKTMDLERLLAKSIFLSANGRDLLALKNSLDLLPDISSWCIRFGGIFAEMVHDFRALAPLKDFLERALYPEPPVSLREGNLIAQGFSEELDELRSEALKGREWIANMQESEREKTGIRSLKVGFNQVFGYYIEVTKANLSSVPEEYHRKQTLANSERYITQELKHWEGIVLGAQEKICELEYQTFQEVREKVIEYQLALKQSSFHLAKIDCLSGFAFLAFQKDWHCPVVDDDLTLEIVGGRHPVVERSLDGSFIANDCHLNLEHYFHLITGPNMSGKSTYLRQNAVLTILAQIGSFLPVEKAKIGICDRVFTRVGASDDLRLGQSTFMVEMSEAANILKHATPRSLVILDEIGRGTSTFDGLALAQAMVEFLHDEVGAKTLFATHFHELTQLERRLKKMRNYRVAVREDREDIVFLHRIVAGGTDKSYGIYVAKLAGVPTPVLERAQELLVSLEKRYRKRYAKKQTATQLGLFDIQGG